LSYDIDKLTGSNTVVLSLAFSYAGDIFCSTAASGTTVLLDYIANIIWNIDIPPMINE
jgi:hypothetical protein